MAKIRPFSSGGEYKQWVYDNCEECALSVLTWGGANDWPKCQIEAALLEAYVWSGKVEGEIYERMNKGGRCSEFEEVGQ